MLDAIIRSIRERRVISLTYDGIHRIVEPHAVGVSKKGSDILRCFQVGGDHVEPGHEWNLLTIQKITLLSVTEKLFCRCTPQIFAWRQGYVANLR